MEAMAGYLVMLIGGGCWFFFFHGRSGLMSDNGHDSSDILSSPGNLYILSHELYKTATTMRPNGRLRNEA